MPGAGLPDADFADVDLPAAGVVVFAGCDAAGCDAADWLALELADGELPACALPDGALLDCARADELAKAPGNSTSSNAATSIFVVRKGHAAEGWSMVRSLIVSAPPPEVFRKSVGRCAARPV